MKPTPVLSKEVLAARANVMDPSVIPDFAMLQEVMTDYVNGVQFDGPLPTDLTDPDPFPPGDELENYIDK